MNTFDLHCKFRDLICKSVLRSSLLPTDMLTKASVPLSNKSEDCKVRWENGMKNLASERTCVGGNNDQG